MIKRSSTFPAKREKNYRDAYFGLYMFYMELKTNLRALRVPGYRGSS
jgi:hypothetical protein